MSKCIWATKTKIEEDYHDNEWGIPVHDDKKLFELIILEGQQAGLSWHTILSKREGMRAAYYNFDPKILSKLTDSDVDFYMNDNRIIKNRLKIKSVINNANAYFKLIEKYDSLDNFLWSFVEYKTIQNMRKNHEDIPAKTELSDKISNELKKLGFKFVGSTTIYALMQSIGMVNDHIVSCKYYDRG